jgi:hypothetical protein
VRGRAPLPVPTRPGRLNPIKSIQGIAVMILLNMLMAMHGVDRGLNPEPNSRVCFCVESSVVCCGVTRGRIAYAIVTTIQH